MGQALSDMRRYTALIYTFIFHGRKITKKAINRDRQDDSSYRLTLREIFSLYI